MAGKIYVEYTDIRKAQYNKDFYYQPRDYIAVCYKKGEVL